MQRYILGRFVQSFAVIIVIVLMVFFAGRLTGDPILLLAPEDAAESDIQRIREHHGLDLPIHKQLLRFVGSSLRGDFGSSTQSNSGAMDRVIDVMPNTFRLGAVAVLIALAISLPIGVLSAVKRDSFIDRFGKLFAVTGQGMPDFWLGLMLMMGIAFYLGLLPIAGSGSWLHIILPARHGWVVDQRSDYARCPLQHAQRDGLRVHNLCAWEGPLKL